MNSLIMSMSGTRGVVGGTLTPQIALHTGLAFGSLWKTGTVVVGGDTRTSHDTYKSAVIAGLLASGVDVVDIGRVPTPTVQQMIHRFNAVAGVVVTASHNPVIWNGLKLMNGSGSFLEDAEYAQFKAIYDAETWTVGGWDQQGKLTIDSTAMDAHVDKILELIDCSAIRNAGLRVLIDANHGAGSVSDPLLLDRLGVKYDILNAEPTGRFAHDPEPLEKNLDQIKGKLAAGGYDIGFVQDADADRLVILDENGRFIGEDYSLAFCVDHILAIENEVSPSVVVNLSTSRILEWIAAKHGGNTIYTKIGESHVTQGIKLNHAVVGGEGNGGVIYPRIGWGRDSLVGIVVALAHLAAKKKTVSEIVSTYPQYAMIRDKIAVGSQSEVTHAIAEIRNRFSQFSQNDTDGVKVTLPNGWVHVRPSNTEPIVRIFVEGDTLAVAQDLMKQAQLS